MVGSARAMNLPVELGASAPLYRDVKRLLTHSIAGGEWLPGAALPSEARLAERFGVSIGTLRKAIDELVAERIVVRQQGRGTFVATHGQTRLLFHFFHIVPREGPKQYPKTRTLAFRKARADAGEAAKLAIGAGDPVFRIRNLLSLDARPVIIDELVVPQRLFPDLSEAILTGRDNTIYHLYQTRYGINVLRTSERLRATLADAEAARLLGLKAQAPLLEIARVALTYDDAPVELRRSLVNTEQHDYFSDLGKPGHLAPR
jgi:GntR family transcriptional regulator